MKITIVTLFPDFFDSMMNSSILARAIQKEKVEIKFVNFRDFTTNKHNKVDDTPYGGGAGMVISCQPVISALQSIYSKKAKVIAMDPKGSVLTQQKVHQLAKEEEIVLLCGHYEGFDERVYDHVDESVSIGDYILTGGEVGAIVVVDAIVRLLDGVIRQDSYQDESFEQNLLEYPQYTRPYEFEGKKVPEILLSGHHENIRYWRLYQSLKATYQKRPDLLTKKILTKEELEIIEKIKKEE